MSPAGRGLGPRVSPANLAVFGLLSLALVATVVWAILKEAGAEWRVHQAAYRALEARETARPAAEDDEALGIQQV